MATPAELAAFQLARETNSWKSIELESRMGIQTFVVIGPKGSKPEWDQVLEHYIETAAGQRFFESDYRLADRSVSLTTGYCDGKRCARIDSKGRSVADQKQIVISKSFLSEDQSNVVERPGSLRYFFVGRTPLHEALAKSEHLGSATILGRPAERFVFRNVSSGRMPQTIVYCLDKNQSIPLKVTSFRAGADVDKDSPIWNWTALKVEEFSGHPIVTDSKVETYAMPKAQNPGAKLMEHHFEITRVAFDKEYPATQFWPEAISSESLVVDTFAKTVKGPRPKPMDPVAVATAQVDAGPASPPSDGSNVLAYTLVAVGLAALVVSAFVTGRRFLKVRVD